MRIRAAGLVRDRQGTPLSNITVECFNHHPNNSDNYLGKIVTDSRGQFEFSFESEPLKTFQVDLGSNNISEGECRPEIYLVISDANGVLYKSNISSNPAELESFDIIIKENDIAFSDPYANSFQREVSLILANVTREVVDLSQVDPARAAQQMIRIFGNLLYYNVQGIQLHGYPGPQVPRYPKRIPHDHSLPWNQKPGHSDGLSF